MPNKATHGGAGRGQGRKPLDPSEPTIRVTIRLTGSQYDWLNRQGNISETLRNLIQEAISHESKDQHK